MPIFGHKEKNIKVFFIHIPRTGGRFIGENFLKNNFEIIHHRTGKKMANEKEREKYIGCIIEDIKMWHWHSALYHKHFSNIQSVPHITVVRDPVNKFFSASSYLKNKRGISEKDLYEYSDFHKVMTSIIRTDFGNWFRPQHQFVSNRTHIWSYEEGLKGKFFDWLSDLLSIKFGYYTDRYFPMEREMKEGIKKDKRIIKNIKQFYQLDYTLVDLGKNIV